MKRNLRILGLVACLLTIWMVTRGTNGCAPVPDASGTLHVEPLENDSDHSGAAVYGSGKLKNKNTANGNLDGSGTGNFELQWYTALQGQEITGIITVISTDGKSHTHEPYTVTNGQTGEAKLKKMTKKK